MGAILLTSLLLKSGDLRDVLRSIVEANLPARGLAHVISVRAVAQSLDAKWIQKRERVWDFVDRTVQRRAPGVMCVQLNEVDFLLAFPTGEPAAATARCIDILKDVLQHFLGRSDEVQQWVRPIHSLVAELAGVDDLVAGSPSAAGDASQPVADDQQRIHGPDPNLWRPSLSRPGASPHWAPISSPGQHDCAEWTMVSGDVQRMAMNLRPVWSLQHGAVSSFRLYRGFSPVAVGYGTDRERLDLAVLDFATGPAALGLMQQGTYLHLPVALNTLLLQRARIRYLDTLKGARHLFRQRVLLELEGVDRGVVESRLQEVVHLLRPFFRLILASSTGQPLRGSSLRSVGVSGAIIDLAAIDEPMTRSTLLAEVSRSKKESSIVVVHGLLEGEIDDESLLAAGASHVSSRPDGRMGDTGRSIGLELWRPATPNCKESPTSSSMKFPMRMPKMSINEIAPASQNSVSPRYGEFIPTHVPPLTPP